MGVNNFMRKCKRIYTIEEIKELTRNIFEKYRIKKAYIFGSYARGEATEKSDIDIMIFGKNSDIKTLLNLAAFENELEEVLKKNVDVVFEEVYTEDIKYDNKYGKLAKKLFYKEIIKDRREIFG